MPDRPGSPRPNDPFPPSDPNISTALVKSLKTSNFLWEGGGLSVSILLWFLLFTTGCRLATWFITMLSARWRNWPNLPVESKRLFLRVKISFLSFRCGHFTWIPNIMAVKYARIADFLLKLCNSGCTYIPYLPTFLIFFLWFHVDSPG